MPPERLPFEPSQEDPTGKIFRGRIRIPWRGYISTLERDHCGIRWIEQESLAGLNNVQVSLLDPVFPTTRFLMSIKQQIENYCHYDLLLLILHFNFFQESGTLLHH